MKDTVGEFGGRLQVVLWRRDDDRNGVGRVREVAEVSLRPRLPGDVPAQSTEVARPAFPTGCPCMRIREVIRPPFADEGFAIDGSLID